MARESSSDRSRDSRASAASICRDTEALSLRSAAVAPSASMSLVRIASASEDQAKYFSSQSRTRAATDAEAALASS